METDGGGLAKRSKDREVEIVASVADNGEAT
ncbi:hypothetical protein COLO4_11798 [Corchorus olitorius]|uniref:Uncharacterized protein n=1 Tax=Corchorus olitorius TaxID=93759 RepID=A0A1R3K371_9ROSI|nr:hypothetical protein COLO4_11798 [Corchorus olitorius]